MVGCHLMAKGHLIQLGVCVCVCVWMGGWVGGGAVSSPAGPGQHPGGGRIF